MKTFKIVLVGDTSVGKTSLVNRFIYKRFSDYINSTVGANFCSYVYEVGDGKIRINIWDTAGQERFRALIPMYYRNVDACLVVFDLSKVNVNNIEYWVEEFLEKSTNPHAQLLLVGNKYDLIDNEIMINRDLENLIKKYKLPFYATSALNGYNIEYLFEELGLKLLKLPRSVEDMNIEIGLNNSEKNYKCYGMPSCPK